MQEQQAQYAKWKRQYMISGVPVVVLADAAGRPFAYTGYDKRDNTGVVLGVRDEGSGRTTPA